MNGHFLDGTLDVTVFNTQSLREHHAKVGLQSRLYAVGTRKSRLEQGRRKWLPPQEVVKESEPLPSPRDRRSARPC